MERKGIKENAKLFFIVFCAAFLVALFISTCITLMLGHDALLLSELRNDAIFALFIGLVQMIWIGSDRNNKTYLIRTIVHFIVLLTGCTLLMIWFGWLPPGNLVITYYVGFVAAYIVLWVIFYHANKRKWKEMNEKLNAYKKANKE